MNDFNTNLKLLKSIFESYVDVKKMKISTELRLNHFDTQHLGKIYFWHMPKTQEEMKRELIKDMKRVLPQFAVYEEFLKDLKIGPVASAFLVNLIYGKNWRSLRTRMPSLRAIYKYYGLAPNEKGTLPHKKHGEKCGFDPEGRSFLIGKNGLGEQLIKHSGRQGKYYEVYVKRKQLELERGIKRFHAHKRALIVMVKCLIRDLYYGYVAHQKTDFANESDAPGGFQTEASNESDDGHGLDLRNVTCSTHQKTDHVAESDKMNGCQTEPPYESDISNGLDLCRATCEGCVNQKTELLNESDVSCGFQTETATESEDANGLDFHAAPQHHNSLTLQKEKTLGGI